MVHAKADELTELAVILGEISRRLYDKWDTLVGDEEECDLGSLDQSCGGEEKGSMGSFFFQATSERPRGFHKTKRNNK